MDGNRDSSASSRAAPRRRCGLGCGLLLAVLLGGCRAPAARNTVDLPERHTFRTELLQVHSDVRLPKSHPLIRDLEALREEVSTRLDLPPQKQPVTVYLFGDELRYSQYIHLMYPNLPPRRAYFVGTSRELAVYTYWGERIQEDLRHEYTHGVLHASLKDVPLWLDEGLAEYFEVASGRNGLNPDYVQRLGDALQSGWRPDLDRLEKLEGVGQMQKADYLEAWAWAHFLLHESPDTQDLLVRYLRLLRDNPRPGVLSARLREEIPQADQRFLAYATSLAGSPLAAGHREPAR